LSYEHYVIDKQTYRQNRKSGIEALKIIAIVLIIISHVVQTLHSKNKYIDFNDYIFHLEQASLNIQVIILQLFRTLGTLGNNIFFICSAWFLLDSDKYNKKKWMFMLIEIWSVSIIIAIITYLLRHGDISSDLLKKSIFPTLFGANWYLTCYLLFYPLHPLLNKMLNTIDRKTHLRASLAMFVLYFGLNFIKSGLCIQ